MQAAAFLVYAGDYLTKPEEVVAKAFGASHASLVTHTRKLVAIQRAAREAKVGNQQQTEQTERVRKIRRHVLGLDAQPPALDKALADNLIEHRAGR